MEIFGLILLALYFILEGKKMFSENKKIFPDGENENFINEYNQIIEYCINTLNPNGKILQFGYSFGNASKKIIKYNIEQLVIIEPEKKIYEIANSWANTIKNITLINKNLDESLSDLECYDSIFLDCFNLKTIVSNNEENRLSKDQILSILVETLILNYTYEKAKIVLLLNDFQHIKINSDIKEQVELEYHDTNKLINIEGSQESLLKILLISKN